MDPEPRGRQGVLHTLRHRNFRMYALGQGVSFVGTWMNRTAQDWLVLELTDNSPAALGIAVAIQFTPVVLLSLWAGLLADRSDNTRLLTWVRLLQGLCAAALAVLVLSGVVTLWQVLVIAGIFGCLTAVEVPVRQALTSEIVGKAGIANALAINSVTVQGSRMAGPAIAGLLITLWGTGSVFVVSALSVMVVHWAMQRIDTAELETPPRRPREGGQMREGLRYLVQRPDIALPILLFLLVTSFTWNIEVVLAPLAAETFERGANGYGQLASALGVGTLLGAFLATRRIRAPRQAALIATTTALGSAQIAMSFVSAYHVLLALMVPMGIGMLTLLNQVTTTVQMKSDDSMRGRMSGYYALSLNGGKPVGALALGLIGHTYGPPAMLRGTGIVTLATAGAVGTWMLVLHRRSHGRPS
jgi:predicted MFS family arabinose efflux permease